MNQQISPKKALLAEDSEPILHQWMTSLELDGFDFGDIKPRHVIEKSKTELVILPLGQHELHITSAALIASQAVQEHSYEVCFMDGTLIGGTGVPAIIHLFKQCPQTKICIISGDPHSLLDSLSTASGVDAHQRIDTEQISCHNKFYNDNRDLLMNGLFAFSKPSLSQTPRLDRSAKFTQ